MEVKRASLVLADISGYTRFTRLHGMSVLHAEQIITELLEAIIDAAEFPLTLSKIEGDALFLYAGADADDPAIARDVLHQVRTFFDAFAKKAAELDANHICPCEACARITDLELKAILHHGEVAFKRIRQFEELAGEDVILVHRLVKNSVRAGEYLMMTERFYDLSGGIPGANLEARVEYPDGLAPTPVRVYYPHLPHAQAAAARPGQIGQRLAQHLRMNRHWLLRLLGLRKAAHVLSRVETDHAIPAPQEETA